MPSQTAIENTIRNPWQPYPNLGDGFQQQPFGLAGGASTGGASNGSQPMPGSNPQMEMMTKYLDFLKQQSGQSQPIQSKRLPVHLGMSGQPIAANPEHPLTFADAQASNVHPWDAGGMGNDRAQTRAAMQNAGVPVHTPSHVVAQQAPDIVNPFGVANNQQTTYQTTPEQFQAILSQYGSPFTNKPDVESPERQAARQAQAQKQAQAKQAQTVVPNKKQTPSATYKPWLRPESIAADNIAFKRQQYEEKRASRYNELLNPRD